MSDMLVKLYNVSEDRELIKKLETDGYKLVRALSPDRDKLVSFALKFSEYWAAEVKAAFANNPVSCYIAVKEGRLAGFACYDATAKNFFGPTGVIEEFRGKGIGKALLNLCLVSMKYDGYGYAVIGGVDDKLEFYNKCCGAEEIKDSSPGIYKRMIY